jgi:hypothetical protein
MFTVIEVHQTCDVCLGICPFSQASLTLRTAKWSFNVKTSAQSPNTRRDPQADIDAYTILLLKLLRMRGSMRSRRASPTKVKAKITPAKASPGKIANQGATSRKS